MGHNVDESEFLIFILLRAAYLQIVITTIIRIGISYVVGSRCLS